MKFLLGLLFLISLPIYSQSDLNTLSPFLGKWQMLNVKSEIYEEWIMTDKEMLVGTSYVIVQGDSIVSENLLLISIGDNKALIAAPRKKQPTLFTLISSDHNEFIFENNEHDFPQRIIYNFVDSLNLKAAIEGSENGEFKRINFTFVKTAD